MAKYIIDIPDDRVCDFVGSTNLLMPYEMAGHKGHHNTGLELTPYTETDREVIENEVWGFAKLFMDDMGVDDLEVVNGDTIKRYFAMTYQEAKAKYEVWKRKKDEIHVGDELKDDGNIRAVVLDIIGEDYMSYDYEVFTENGIIDGWQKGIVVKTGRHFPEVGWLLKRMSEED